MWKYLVKVENTYHYSMYPTEKAAKEAAEDFARFSGNEGAVIQLFMLKECCFLEKKPIVWEQVKERE